MKFLFVVQGEGRGHLTQSITLSEMLVRNGHEVVAVLLGKSKRREIPLFFHKHFPFEVRSFESPNFLPASKNKRTNIGLSILYNLLKTGSYLKSIFFIRKQIKCSGADVVVNFYDLLTGITYALLSPQTPCICIAHQYLFMHPEYTFPPANKLELCMLKLFTRITCTHASKILALSLKKMVDVPEKRIVVVPPLLRKEVFEVKVSDGNYLHGYMLNDTYVEDIVRFQETHPDVYIDFFWDRKGVEAVTRVNDHLTFHALDDRLFIDCMAGCKAYCTTAGFESVCEALYMGKPVLMVPTHIEQQCNAYEASQLGAGIAANDFEFEKLFEYLPHYQKQTAFREWVLQAPEYFLSTFIQISPDSI
jgi:uncharacterized protein (TIGR00661 family)